MPDSQPPASVPSDIPVDVPASATPEPVAVTPEPPKPMPKTIETKINPEPEKAHKKAVVETKPQKIVVEAHKHEHGPGCGCRLISCGGCLLFLAMIVAVVFVVIQRPPAVVNPIKIWLNDGLVAAGGDGTTAEAAFASLAAQAASFKVGENSLVIKENELQAILQSKYVGDNTVNVRVLAGRVKLYIDGDRGSAVPLWLVAEVGSEDGQHLRLSKLGTERISTPAFMNEFLTRVIFSIANLVSGKGTASADNLLSAVIPLPENIELKAVKIESGQMTVTLDMKSGFENIFEL